MVFMEAMQTTTHRPGTGRKEGHMASTTDLIIAQAMLHSDANASAALCVEDAQALRAEGNIEAAGQRALKSLAHSVGMFHNDYRWAANRLALEAELA